MQEDIAKARPNGKSKREEPGAPLAPLAEGSRAQKFGGKKFGWNKGSRLKDVDIMN